MNLLIEAAMQGMGFALGVIGMGILCLIGVMIVHYAAHAIDKFIEWLLFSEWSLKIFPSTIDWRKFRK